MTQPPFETRELRKKLTEFLNSPFTDPDTGESQAVGGYKFGVYAFYDYDLEPIYVGQTSEGIRTRIRRHLTNQRTDAVAMKVLDPYEVFEIEVWPLPKYQGRATTDSVARAHLSWLESDVFHHLLGQSRFRAVLNEKVPTGFEGPGSDQFLRRGSVRGRVVSEEVLKLRKHSDTRIARRAETLSLLAKVISERQVQAGLRRTLLTQARRLAWLAETRLGDFEGVPDEATEPEPD